MSTTAWLACCDCRMCDLDIKALAHPQDNNLNITYCVVYPGKKDGDILFTVGGDITFPQRKFKSEQEINTFALEKKLPPMDKKRPKHPILLDEDLWY